MKKYWLLLFAITPIGIGYIYNYSIVNCSNIMSTILSLIFIVYWFWVGYISPKFTKSSKKAFLLTNSVAIIFFVLVIVQDAIIGRYFSNIFGILPQMFYLPTIKVASIFQNIILFFLSQYYMWMTYVIAFILMMLVYYRGRNVGSRKDFL